jgi:hypothetical protein
MLAKEPVVNTLPTDAQLIYDLYYRDVGVNAVPPKPYAKLLFRSFAVPVQQPY